MDIQRLKELSGSLNKIYQPKTSQGGLVDQLSLKYHQSVLSKLDALFKDYTKDGPLLTKHLEIFLSDNWDLVNGTVLSPTSLADSEVTGLLCSIAEFVAFENNQNLESDSSSFTALQFLMPTVSLESSREYIFDNDSNPIGEGYPSFDSSTPLLTLLQTHILGHDGQYLLPIKLLTELTTMGDFSVLLNPYFDYSKHKAENTNVSYEEYQRLAGHSTLTRALAEAKSQYNILSTDTSSLLGQLSTLCDGLHSGSTVGSGSETSAGIEVYPAIIKFMEYYNHLNKTDIKKIPRSLRKEIDLLLKLVTDKTSNINATENMETCVATRFLAIKKNIKGHEDLLSQIGRKKDLFLKATLKKLEAMKAELEQSLTSKKYGGGQDKLRVKQRLFETLQVPYSIIRFSELELLCSFTAPEMAAALKDGKLGPHVLRLTPTRRDLIHFLRMLEPETLMIFLTSTRDQFSKQVLESPQDLSIFLSQLDSRTFTICCETLKPSITKMLVGKDRFAAITMRFSTEQNLIFYGMMKEKIVDLVDTRSAFEVVISRLSETKKSQFIEGIFDKLLSFIKTADDVSIVLRHMSEDQRKIAYDDIKKRLPDMIKSVRDYDEVMKYLPKEQRSDCFKRIKDKLPGLVHSTKDYIKTVEAMTADDQDIALELMKHKLIGMVMNSEADKQTLLEFLPLEKKHPFLHLLAFVDHMKYNKDGATAFVSALMSDNINNIKTQLDLIFDHAKKSTGYSKFRFLSPKNPTTKPIDSISHLDLCWLKKINIALDLKIPEEQLQAKAMKTALKSYTDNLRLDPNSTDTKVPFADNR